MTTKESMTENINIRLDSDTATALRAIKAETGISPAQIARTGIQKAIAQYKADGFLKIENTEPTPQKP